MTAQISAYGRLVADPQTRTTGKGTNMAMARLAVSLPCNTAEDGQAPFWLGILAFGKQADVLAKHQKGDLVVSDEMVFPLLHGSTHLRHDGCTLISEKLEGYHV